MNADDLTKPLTPMPRQQRPGIVLPIVAATLAGIFSGWLILFDAVPDRGKPLSPASLPQPALAVESVHQTAAVPEPALAMPPAKTITVIDSKTSARREVVVPATNDQSEGKPATARSAATIAPADTAGARGAKSKRQ